MFEEDIPLKDINALQFLSQFCMHPP